MQDQFQTGSVTVDKMSRLHISGNIVPVTWYKTIWKSTGKPNLNAIIILADIVYWYRPTEVRDEMTGELIGLKKKFHADLLQRSYQQIADQFGITKRDATNAVVELEKLKVIRRVFRTLYVNGQQVPNVLFLDLNVEVLETLTYPEQEQGCHLNKGYHSLKKERGITDMVEKESLFRERAITDTGDTNTENTDINFDTENSYLIQIEKEVKEQISYEVLKHDDPYNMQIDELVGILLDVKTCSAKTIRVNREDKPAEIVKAQFQKISMEHIQFVLNCMEKNTTKVTNMRAMLITALYNSVNTISSYYSSLYNYHRSYGVSENEEEE